MTGCSAARMPGFRPAAPEYINIYILFMLIAAKRLYYICCFLFYIALHLRHVRGYPADVSLF